MHLNPDDYLQTGSGRIYTPERNAAAWERLHEELERAVELTRQPVVIVIGVQGAGKTTWVKRQMESRTRDAIWVDSTAATVARRARLIDIAKRAEVWVVGAWVTVPLDVALNRNRLRSSDEIVPDSAIENIFGLLEPPTVEEGFDEVLIVDANASTTQNS